MAKIGGRQIEIGIGIEAAAGTAVSATDYMKWDSFTMQGQSDKILLNSARGIRNKTSNSIVMKQYGKGDVEFAPTVDIMPYILHLALGSIANATNADVSGLVYDHTCTVQNANASMATATLIVKEGGVQTERYANCVVDSLDLTIDKDFAKCKVGFIGGYPDSGTITPSYTQDTLFSKNQMTVKLGTTLTTAAAAVATPMVNFSLQLKNNVQLEDAFLSGSATPAAGAFISGPLELKGSYTIQFSDAVELAKYKANTLNAMIVTLTGAAIGTAAFELMVFKLGRLVLTKAPLEFNLDGIVFVKQEFEVQYDATDKEIQAIVTNLNIGTNY